METEISAPISEVQRFSIHDGPGIRTLIFFKGCYLRCRWCHNPESIEARPVVAFYERRCGRTFECAAVCPNEAIRRDGFRVDHDLCNLCGKCVTACAHGALRMIGESLTPSELLKRLLPDLPYYRRSGGGITFSGGEPTLYAEFMETFLQLAEEHDIHSNLETCGLFNFRRLMPLLGKLDLIYYDLKIMDADKHALATGAGNGLILRNARCLVAGGYPVEFRMPLVPGFTDDTENIAATIEFLHELKVEQIHLLRYHNMGEAKIGVIGGSHAPLGLENFGTARYEEIGRQFCGNGIEVVGSE